MDLNTRKNYVLTHINAFFLKTADNKASGNTKSELVRITDRLELPLTSRIAGPERKNSKTVVAFRVIYTFSAFFLSLT